MKQVLLLLASLLTLGCQPSDNNYDQVEDTAGQWADAYFNCRLSEAQKYVTADSERWLRFVASNMTEGDVELLNARETGAEVEVTDVYVGSDTLATAMVRVAGWLSWDSIGRPGKMHNEDGSFLIDLVKRDGRWMVRMAGLPQSERQSRD